MAEHGQHFPENPRNVDELMDSLAKRAAAAQRFRNSLSEPQRAELDALAQQAFGSPSLMNALNRLDANLQAARPGEDWSGPRSSAVTIRWAWARAPRRWPISAELEQLAEQLSQSYAGRQHGGRRPGHAGPPARRRAPRSMPAPRPTWSAH